MSSEGNHSFISRNLSEGCEVRTKERKEKVEKWRNFTLPCCTWYLSHMQYPVNLEKAIPREHSPEKGKVKSDMR